MEKIREIVFIGFLSLCITMTSCQKEVETQTKQPETQSDVLAEFHDSVMKQSENTVFEF